MASLPHIFYRGTFLQESRIKSRKRQQFRNHQQTRTKALPTMLIYKSQLRAQRPTKYFISSVVFKCKPVAFYSKLFARMNFCFVLNSFTYALCEFKYK